MTTKKTVRNTREIEPLEQLATAAFPGGIEAQEEQGQRELVQSDVLPTDLSRSTREEFEKMGFKFGEVVPDDTLFQYAELPPGWKKVSTDHAMWSQILDDKGRERVRVFYKAAFYDRRANMSIVARFSLGTKDLDANKQPVRDHKEVKAHRVEVLDLGTGKVVFSQVREMLPGEEWIEAWGEADKIGKAWLDEHYPNHTSKSAYWDQV